MTDLPGINNQVVAIAYQWLGTPYRHQACLKGIGVDCIGLVIGIAKELYGGLPKDFVLPAYSPRWAEESKKQLMVTYGQKYLQIIEPKNALPGDVLMYQMLRNGPTKHTGILVGEKRIIHSYYPHGVVETPQIIGNTVTLTHAFRLPETMEVN